MFDWDDLKVFLAAHREGSIGRAAESLGVSGSTVSRRLTALEGSLGQTLFVRSPDGLKPTAAGSRAWTDAQEAERAVARMRVGLGEIDTLHGTVRVSTSSELLHTVLLPNWPDFAAAHPRITVEFVESTQLADLERCEADIAIRAVRPQAGDNLVITRLRDSKNCLFGSRHLLASRGLDPDDAEALAAVEDWSDWPWIDWTEEFCHLPLAKGRRSKVPDARVVMRLANLESIRLAAAAGIGIALIPSYFGRVSPNLVKLPNLDVGPVVTLFLLGHVAVRNTARVAAVWETLVTLLRGTDDAQLEEGRAAITAAYGVRYAGEDSP